MSCILKQFEFMNMDHLHREVSNLTPLHLFYRFSYVPVN